MSENETKSSSIWVSERSRKETILVAIIIVIGLAIMLVRQRLNENSGHDNRAANITNAEAVARQQKLEEQIEELKQQLTELKTNEASKQLDETATKKQQGLEQQIEELRRELAKTKTNKPANEAGLVITEKQSPQGAAPAEKDSSTPEAIPETPKKPKVKQNREKIEIPLEMKYDKTFELSTTETTPMFEIKPDIRTRENDWQGRPCHLTTTPNVGLYIQFYDRFGMLKGEPQYLESDTGERLLFFDTLEMQNLPRFRIWGTTEGQQLHVEVDR